MKWLPDEKLKKPLTPDFSTAISAAMNCHLSQFVAVLRASKKESRATNLLTMLGLGLLVTGCAAIKPEAMVPEKFELESRHPATLSVMVPRATMNKIYGEGHWSSQITANTFAASLLRSLRESGVFSRVLDTPDGDYLLHVSFVSAQEPAAALDMKVQLVTKWILTRRSSGEDVFRENVATTYVAKLGRAFAGGTRLRLANEGAGRENIEEGIRRLSALKL